MWNKICSRKSWNEWVMDGQSWSFKKKSKKIVDFQTKLSKKMLRTNTKKKNLDSLGLQIGMTYHRLIQLLFTKLWKHWATKLLNDFCNQCCTKLPKASYHVRAAHKFFYNIRQQDFSLILTSMLHKVTQNLL
jgi:hypothetical protein